MRQATKAKYKGLFKSKTVRIMRNLDYKEGGEGLLSGTKLRTMVCPMHLREVYFDAIWVRWNNKPLRLVSGEYEII